MSREEYFRRYLVYMTGLYIMALGLAMIIVAELGTSPVSTWTYVMSLNTPPSVGMWTFILSIILIVGQVVVLYRHGLRQEISNIVLQLPFAVVFGAFIDFNLLLVTKVPLSSDYSSRLLMLLVGIVVQSYGIMLEVKAGVAMTSAEAFVNYVSRRVKKPFGTLKVGFDVLLVLLAAATSVAFSLSAHRPVWPDVISIVREGTVIAALTTGMFVNFFARRDKTEQFILNS